MWHGEIRGTGKRWSWVRAGVVLVALLLSAYGATAPTARAATAADWTTYLGDNAHTGFNGSETAITRSSAPNLKLAWSAQAGGTISTQPIVSAANNLIYWGAWDGYERATYATGTSKGQTAWSTFLGQNSDSADGCVPPQAGVASTGTVQPVTIGSSSSVLFVGGGGNIVAPGAAPSSGGQAMFYALDALTGNILWQTALGPSPANFMWSSPAYYNGSLYVGVASFGDCPLVQGKVVKMNAVTGAVQATFKVVPDGCVGGGVWGSPAIDEAAGTVYINTGNPDPGGCSQAGSSYVESVVELKASDLSVVGSWTVPNASQIPDGDFGSAVTLFSAKTHGSTQLAAGIQNKNGEYYTFARDNLSAGPLWRKRISNGGECPQCGTGSIAPSAFDGKYLYVGGGQVTMNGTSCQGSVQALNPANGNGVWQICLQGTVLGAVTAAPGIVVFTAFGGNGGNHVTVVNSSSGNVLFSYPASGSDFYGAATVVNSGLYVGDVNGNLYTFTP